MEWIETCIQSRVHRIEKRKASSKTMKTIGAGNGGLFGKNGSGARNGNN